MPWVALVFLVALGGCLDRGVGKGQDLMRDTELPDPDHDADDDECICPDGSICFNGVCVGEGMLRVSLVFPADSDFDLHLRTPLGSEIYFLTDAADGGYLDVDTCIRACGDGPHVENIYFPDEAPSGTYSVWVVNYDGRAAGTFEIDVSGFEPPFASGTLSAERGDSSEIFTFEH